MRAAFYFGFLFVAAQQLSVANAQTTAYCLSSAKSSVYEWISSVTLNEISNASGSSPYSDYSTSAVSFKLRRDSANNIRLKPGYASGQSWADGWSVWIDLNRDGLFGLEERVVASPIIANEQSLNFLLPTNVKSGPARMRVSMTYGRLPSACEMLSWGEVEDYTVQIPEVVPVNPQPNYCSMKGNSTNWESIGRVKIADFINQKMESGSGYEDFSTLPGLSIVRGQETAFSLTPFYAHGVYPENWAAWIDLNGNGSFTDAGERIVKSETSISGDFNGSFTLPANAPTGTRRLRIALSYGSQAPESCGSFTYGQVEDYTVTISPAVEMPAPGSLDLSFNNTGILSQQIEGQFVPVVAHPGQNSATIVAGVLVGASYPSYDPNLHLLPGQITVFRLLANGSIDPSFAALTGGKVSLGQGVLRDMIVGAQGEIYVLMRDSYTDKANLFKLTSSGAIDPQFAQSGVLALDPGTPVNMIEYMSPESGPSLTVLSYEPGSYPRYFALSSYRADGSRNLSFGSNGQVKIPSGSVLRLGSMARLQSSVRDSFIIPYLKNLNKSSDQITLVGVRVKDGALDSEFGTLGISTLTVKAFVVDSLEKIIPMPFQGMFSLAGTFYDVAMPDPISRFKGFMLAFSENGKQIESFASGNSSAFPITGSVELAGGMFGEALVETSAAAPVPAVPEKIVSSVFTRAGGSKIIRLNSSGKYDLQFDGDGAVGFSDLLSAQAISISDYGNGKRLNVFGINKAGAFVQIRLVLE